MSNVISEYYSDDMSLKAAVSLENKIPHIRFYKNNNLIKIQSFPHNTIHYVEDTAENYTLNILKL